MPPSLLALWAILIALFFSIISAFPLLPTDVGIPAGVALTVGDLSLYSNVSNVLVERKLFLNSATNLLGSNMTFRQCRFYMNDSTVTASYFWVLVVTGDNITFDQIEMFAEEDRGIAIDYFLNTADTQPANMITVTNSRIQSVRVGILTDRVVTISNNYIECTFNRTDSNDPITIGPHRSGSEWAYITENTLVNAAASNSALSLGPSSTVSAANIVVRGNLFRGGGWTVYGGSLNESLPTINLHFYDNEFSTLYHPYCGYWGPITDLDLTGTGSYAFNNTWYEPPGNTTSVRPDLEKPFPSPALCPALPLGFIASTAVCQGGAWVFIVPNIILDSTTIVNITSPLTINSTVSLVSARLILSSTLSISGGLSLTGQSSLVLVPNSSLHILGNLVLSSDSTFELSPDASVNVSGCIELSGELVVPYTSGQPNTLEILPSNCTTGSFSKITVIPSAHNECEAVTATSQSETALTLILFSIQDLCTGATILPLPLFLLSIALGVILARTRIALEL